MISRFLRSLSGDAAATHRGISLANEYIRKLFHIEVEREKRCLLESDSKYKDPKNLNRFEFQIFSQSGQDGIINEIFRRIGASHRVFVEFGVGAGGGMQNNTTNLLSQGWSGMWIEGNPHYFETIRKDLAFLIDRNKLTVVQNLVIKSNINTILRDQKIPKDLDLLSIDIDGNDIYVLEEILGQYSPRVIAIEYNAYFPGNLNWKVDYSDSRVWDERGIEFGASLAAFCELAARTEYQLVACDLTGSDAFFVRKDLIGDKFQVVESPLDLYEPMRYHLIGTNGYQRRLTSTFGLTIVM